MALKTNACTSLENVDWLKAIQKGLMSSMQHLCSDIGKFWLMLDSTECELSNHSNQL